MGRNRDLSTVWNALMLPLASGADQGMATTPAHGDEYTGADLFVDVLAEYGVTHLFGNPGTTELPVVRALSGSDIEYVLALHEDVAVGMAAGYACAKRYQSHSDPSLLPIGVVNLHLVAGVAHGLGNLYNAKITGAPLVVTAGNHSQTVLHDETVLGGDLVGLAAQFTKWSTEVRDVDALPATLRRAFRTALTPPTGPVFISLPLDVLMAETSARPERLGRIPSAGGGDPADINAAVELLVAAEDPLLVVGDGVARCGAVEAAVGLAEASGARVYGEILASEIAFPTDHDQWFSYLPVMDESLARDHLRTDTLVVVGCSTNTTFMRRAGDLVSPETACIQISDDPHQIGKNHPVDVAVIGDIGLVLSELTAQLRRRLPLDERDRRLTQVANHESGRKRAESTTTHLTTATLVDTIRTLASDAFVVDETLTSKDVLLTRWSLPPGRYLSNKGLGLGYGLPAAVGAAIAESESSDRRPVIGFIGDGSSLFYLNALYSASRYGIDLVVVVVDNRSYRVLEENYARMFDSDDEVDLTALRFDPPVDIPRTAEGFGATAQTVSDADELAEALRTALETTGPVLLDVLVQDDVDASEPTEAGPSGA